MKLQIHACCVVIDSRRITIQDACITKQVVYVTGLQNVFVTDKFGVPGAEKNNLDADGW